MTSGRCCEALSSRDQIMLALFPPVCRLLAITVRQVSMQLVIRALSRQKSSNTHCRWWIM